MTKTEELLKLAEAVLEGAASIATYYDAAHPQTIKQLVELVRLQHDAIGRVGRDQYPVIEEAIEAFEKFERNE